MKLTEKEIGIFLNSPIEQIDVDPNNGIYGVRTRYISLQRQIGLDGIKMLNLARQSGHDTYISTLRQFVLNCDLEILEIKTGHSPYYDEMYIKYFEKKQ